MKRYGKFAGGLGLALLTGLCGCKVKMSSPASGDSGKVALHIDAKESDNGFSLNIKGDFGNTASEAVTQIYNAAKIALIEIEETSGDVKISIQKGDADEIIIKAIKSVNGEEAEAELKPFLTKIKPMVQRTGDTLSIYTERDNAAFEKHGGWISYEIRVPKRLAAQVRTASGEIEIESVTGRVSAESVSGNINFSDPHGAVSARTTSGKIGMAISKDANVDLKLTTTSGNLELTEEEENTLQSEKEIKKTIGKGGQPVSLQTTSGNIEVDIEGEMD